MKKAFGVFKEFWPVFSCYVLAHLTHNFAMILNFFVKNVVILIRGVNAITVKNKNLVENSVPWASHPL